MTTRNFHTRNVTDGLKATDIHWILRGTSVIPVKGLSIDSLSFGEDFLTLNKDFIINGYINYDALVGTPVDTAVTETIDSKTCTVVRQTASGITTTLSNLELGTEVTIFNVSTGSNTIGHTINGIVSPSIKKKEAFKLMFNGTDFDLI